jgi:hypothetical protein
LLSPKPLREATKLFRAQSAGRGSQRLVRSELKTANLNKASRQLFQPL